MVLLVDRPVEKLIDADGVDFLFGPYSSGLTTGASANAEANDVIMVEANGNLQIPCSSAVFGIYP